MNTASASSRKLPHALRILRHGELPCELSCVLSVVSSYLLATSDSRPCFYYYSIATPVCYLLYYLSYWPTKWPTPHKKKTKSILQIVGRPNSRCNFLSQLLHMTCTPLSSLQGSMRPSTHTNEHSKAKLHTLEEAKSL